MDAYDNAIDLALERGEDPQQYVNRTTGVQNEFQVLLERYWKALQIVECDDCGHDVNLHDAKEGCTFERGDAWVTGNQGSQPTVLMAQGPCGCTAIKFCDNCGAYPCICHGHECQQCGKIITAVCVCEKPNRLDWCSSNCRAAFDL
jgi:hypothetical protein